MNMELLKILAAVTCVIVSPVLTAEVRLREPMSTLQIDRQERRLILGERGAALNRALPVQDRDKELSIVTEELIREQQQHPDAKVVIDIIEDERIFENMVDSLQGSPQPPPPPPDRGPTPANRGLVPQLWKNYSGPVEPPPENVSCSLARLKCSYRAGCGLALRSYALGCSELARGRTKVCSTHCRHSLIALLSTLEGDRLMKCNCEGDEFCEMSKANIEPCKDQVMHATKEDAIVSCPVAQWICAADPLCSTALEYYNINCRAMFRGKKCSKRCLNSISILRRQGAARKLETCLCDGTEDYDCNGIKANMEKLCFSAENEIISNEIEATGSNSSASPNMFAKIRTFILVCSVFVSIFVAYLSSLITGPARIDTAEESQ